MLQRMLHKLNDCKVNMISAKLELLAYFLNIRQYFTITMQVATISSAASAALRSTESTRTSLFTSQLFGPFFSKRPEM